MWRCRTSGTTIVCDNTISPLIRIGIATGRSHGAVGRLPWRSAIFASPVRVLFGNSCDRRFSLSSPSPAGFPVRPLPKAARETPVCRHLGGIEDDGAPDSPQGDQPAGADEGVDAGGRDITESPCCLSYSDSGEGLHGSSIAQYLDIFNPTQETGCGAQPARRREALATASPGRSV